MNYMPVNNQFNKHFSYKWRSHLIGLTCLLIGLFPTLPSYSQTFHKIFPEFTEGWEILQTQDQGFVVMGRSGDITQIVDNDIVLFKVDVDGQTIWESSIGEDDLEQAFEIVETADEGFVIAGISSSFSGGPTDVAIYKTDKFGNLIWQKKFGAAQSPDQANDIIELSDRSGFITVGCYDCPRGATNGIFDAYVIKTDPFGNLVWSQAFGESNKQEEAMGVIETPDGQYLVFGTVIHENGNEDLFLLSVDANGNQLWKKNYGVAAKENASAIVRTQDGNYLLGGTTYAFDILGQQPDAWVLKVDDEGEVLWNKNYGKAGGDLLYDLINTQDGGYAFAGATWSYGYEDGDFYLVKLDASGNEQWVSATGGLGEQQAKGLSQTPDGRFAMTGISNAADFSLEVIITDAQGQLNSNTINGQVFMDDNKDCQYQTNEKPLSGWIVKASGDQDYYGTTDEVGHYEIEVPEGNYVVSINSVSNYFVPCQTSVFTELPDAFSTQEVNFQMQPDIYCPNLEIDISTPLLSPCKLNNYKVNYRNSGTTDAQFSYAEIQLDEQIQIISSPINYTSLGNNSYRFELGTIPSNQDGQFEIRTQLACNAIAGKTHCVAAQIFPNEICNQTNIGWNGASIAVEAICLADSIEFTISNDGQGTADDVQYHVIEEDVVVFINAPTTIEAEQKIIYKTKATDGTFRIQARQALGHPGESMPTAVIEGCESDNDGNFSLGYVTQFPDDDANSFISMDCQENIGLTTTTVNPFANNGFPKGRKEEKFIQPNTDIEYLIRFQNTSTTTLSNVVVRDTLSQFMDPATLRPGASSHPFEFEVYDNGILKVTFDDINLPSQFVNSESSQGFVKFRISQKRDNAPGTVINNLATIYINEEAPVKAPSTFHTIETATEYSRADIKLCENQPYSGQYFQEDALVYDTIGYEEYREIRLSYLSILESSEASIDTVLAKGGLYNNIAYYNDTSITHLLTGENSCDSILTVHIMIDPTSTHDIGLLSNIRLSPNPTTTQSRLNFTLEEGTNLQVSLVNLLGQHIQQIIPNDFLQQGQYTIPIDMAKLSPGTYHILFTSERGRSTQKFIVLGSR